MPTKSKGKNLEQSHQDREFGGPIGTFFFIAFSHVLPYYLWISNTYFRGALIGPSSVANITPWLKQMTGLIATGARPTWSTVTLYALFLAWEGFTAIVMPGPSVNGLPIARENGKVLAYKCNALASWWATLALAGLLHFSGVFPLSFIVDHLGSLLTVSMIAGDLLAVLVYLSAKVQGTAHRNTGNVVYDLFMGINLNPRFLGVDIKMWAEIRVSWTILFFITLSAVAKQWEQHGAVSGPLLVLLLAHFLYTNACQKGEECIPTTFDISSECFGWMLCFWNLAGVPFVYCFQSVFVFNRGPSHSIGSTPTLVLVVVLVSAYYVWDTANSQKNRFRMQRLGTLVQRPWAFPQLPWGTVKNPRFIRCENGGTLLTDGWYRYARKIHYTADIIMALCWGLACGTTHFLPFFYVLFFTLMITHRNRRDIAKCRVKYDKDWGTYVKTVPYSFIPFIY